MNLSNAPEIATRTGAVQPAVQGVAPKVTRNRDSESDRQSGLGEDHEEDFSAAGTRPAPLEKKVTRRETRRRRQSSVETRRTETGREVEGRRKSSDVETTARSEKPSKALGRRGAGWTTEQGLKTAQQLLHQQSLLQQASLQFEQARGPQQPATTPFGQQQAMLDSLISMTEMLYHQHTGDKAGEIFSRPATRQLLTALKGLKNGAVGAEETSPEVQAPRRSKREFQSQLDRIERVQYFINPAPLPADYEPLDLVA